MMDLRRVASLSCTGCGERSSLFAWFDACTGVEPDRRWLRGGCPSCEAPLWIAFEGDCVSAGVPSEDRRFFLPDQRVEQRGLSFQHAPEGLLVGLQHRSWVFAPLPVGAAL